MNFKTSFAALAITTAFVGGNGNALAEDAKVFPGSNCHPQSHSSATLAAGINGVFYNNSSTRNVIVNCPLVRDTVTNTDGAYLRVIVRKFGLSQVQGFRCTLMSSSQLGSTLAATSKGTVEQGVRALDLGVNRRGRFGSYQATCTVPPRGRIYSYKLSED